eukprot:9487392-Lingulodinium_polyedra.AAC.1
MADDDGSRGARGQQALAKAASQEPWPLSMKEAAVRVASMWSTTAMMRENARANEAKVAATMSRL